MSKKRKKNSHNKKHHKKKQQSLSRFEKMKQQVSLDPIKTFFIELKDKLKALDMSSSSTSARNYISRNKKGVIFTLAMTMIVAIGYFGFVLPNTNKTSNDEIVSMNLEESAFMDAESQVQDIQGQEEAGPTAAVAKMSSDMDMAIEPSIDVITSSPVKEGKLSLELVQEKSIYDSVAQSMMIGIDMYAIVVDNKEVAYFQTEAKAQEVIDLIKAKHIEEGAVEEKVLFSETVEILKVKRNIFDVADFRTPEAIIEFIEKGTNEQRIHVVVKGDNFWDIASKYELNVQDLLDANPDIEEKRLQIGTELSLIVAEPIINVVTIATVERIDPVPYGRAPNVLTDKYYEGEYKTKVAGKQGEAEVIVEIYKQNGKLIGEKVLEQNVIKQPVDQIVYQGTKPAPPRIGTGTYQKPTSRGYITSPFGPRSLGYHYGIDIGLPMYSDVYAADGGVVKFAGYKGSYGKVVIINHGANTETRYAHNSKLLVRAGENVHKGQLIAMSGNTGRSTGPHLHFEIRINDNPINPKKYVRY